MARTKAINLLDKGTGKVELAELSGFVIDNIQKETLSTGLKSQQYTGNPAAGSVEFVRFVNSKSNIYGTARTAKKGDAIHAPKVTVNLDQHKEIVEEIPYFDMQTFGVGNILARRADNHVMTVAYDLDSAFFNEAKTAGTAFTPKKKAIGEVLEEMIVTLETVQNEFVRGINRNLMSLILSPAIYSELRNVLDTGVHNANVDTAAEAFGVFHGVKTYSNVFMPDKVDAILMVNGAIAEPVIITQYSNPEKIELSNDYGVSIFYDYGVKALTPDLIFTYTVAAGTGA